MHVVSAGDGAGIAKSASRFVDGFEGHAGRVAAVADLLTQVAERGQRPLPGAEILRRNVFTRNSDSSAFTSTASIGWPPTVNSRRARCCFSSAINRAMPGSLSVNSARLPDFAGNRSTIRRPSTRAC